MNKLVEYYNVFYNISNATPTTEELLKFAEERLNEMCPSVHGICSSPGYS